MASKYSIEASFKLIDDVTKKLNDIAKVGDITASKLKGSYTAAERRINKFGENIAKTWKYAQGAIYGAATAFAVKGIKDAMEFSTSLAQISITADTAILPMEKIQSELLKMSQTTGIAVNELAQAEYNALSSGIDTAGSLEFVATVAKAAKAGFTDTAVAVKGLSAVLNAYGLETSEVGKISDQMFLAMDIGSASFGEITESMGKVIPVASALGVKTDEVFSAIATMTLPGLNAAETITGLSSALSSIMKPSSEAGKMAQRLGIDFSAAALQSKGLEQFLNEVGKAAGGDMEKLGQLFGNKNAINAITILTGEGADTFRAAMERMRTEAGATERALEKIMATPQERWNKAMNAMTLAGIRLGTALLPVVNKFTDKINEFADNLSQADFDKFAAGFSKGFDVIVNTIQLLWKFRIAIGAIAATTFLYKRGMEAFVIGSKAAGLIKDIKTGIGIAQGIMRGSHAAEAALSFSSDRAKVITGFVRGLQGIGGKMFDIWKLAAIKVATLAVAAAQGIATAATAAWSTATGVLNALFIASPIGWIVLGIAALIAIIILAVKHWDKITAAIKTAWEWMGKNTEQVMALISIFYGPFGVIISIIKELRDNWGAIVEAFKTDGIIAGFKKLGGVIFSAVLAPIQGLLELLAKIPGVDQLLGPAVQQIQAFRNDLKGIEDIQTEISAVVPPGLTQTTTAGMTYPALSTAAIQPTTPITPAERQYYYSRSESSETVNVDVRAMPGTAVRQQNQTRSPNVRVTASGDNF
jgi:TP901 family phage tail tape measure protein